MNCRFESQALYDIANRFRIRSRKFGLQRSENHSAEDDIGYVSRSSSEEIDEKRRNINDRQDTLYDNNLNIFIIFSFFFVLPKFLIIFSYLIYDQFLFFLF